MQNRAMLLVDEDEMLRGRDAEHRWKALLIVAVVQMRDVRSRGVEMDCGDGVVAWKGSEDAAEMGGGCSVECLLSQLFCRTRQAFRVKPLAPNLGTGSRKRRTKQKDGKALQHARNARGFGPHVLTTLVACDDGTRSLDDAALCSLRRALHERVKPVDGEGSSIPRRRMMGLMGADSSSELHPPACLCFCQSWMRSPPPCCPVWRPKTTRMCLQADADAETRDELSMAITLEF